MANTQWFEDARFGLFLHWGLYAVPAKGEWYASIQRVPSSRYHRYLESFDPVDYDPKAWAKMARQAGMRYAVLTAKHHEGFCLFDSAYTDYKATNSPAGRDLVAEYVETFRAEGLRVGLYYSLVDWNHPDYPAYHDPFHPERGLESRREEACSFDRYLDYMHGQIRELCTNYGKIDLLWLDFSYDDYSGPGWRAEELVKMVRSLQPDILINSRLEASGGSLGSLLSGTPSPWAGDFANPEQVVPPKPLRRPDGTPVCWEACQSMNNSFGYTRTDTCYKSAKTCIRQLVNCVSKGGNYLLNVGPDARGNFPPQAKKILTEMGQWMDRNQESIYGCTIPSVPLDAFGCRVTGKGDTLYLHVLDQPVGPLAVTVPGGYRIQQAVFLETGAEAQVLTQGWAVDNYPDTTFISLAAQPNETAPLPDETDTVLRLTLSPCTPEETQT